MSVFKGVYYGLKRFDVSIIIIITILLTAFIAPNFFDQGLRSAISPLLEVKERRVQEEEARILLKVKKIPGQEYKKNLRGYEELLQLRPGNEKYKSKVQQYSVLIEKQNKEKVKAAAAKKVRAAAEAKKVRADALARAKAAEAKKARVAELARQKKEDRERAVAKARKEKVEKFKRSLVRSKWAGDMIQHKKKGRYITGTNIRLRFKKDYKVDFEIYKDAFVSLGNGKVRANSSALFYSNTGSFKYTVDSKMNIKIKVSGLEKVDTDFAIWNPNQTWTVKIRSEKEMVLESRGLSSSLKKKSY